MEHTRELQDYVDTVVSRATSDIHLISNTKPLFRVRRELVPFIQKEPLTDSDTASFLSIILKMSREETVAHMREKKNIQMSYKHRTSGDREINFRVMAYMEKGSVAIAMRLINEIEQTVEELNLSTILKNVIREPHGLFLVVGPAGNGKSTTLTALINHCNNTQRRHILTIEDPIEFIYRNKKSVITQREVPFDALSFRAALDSSLRADADILMVGEMREVVTMQTVMTAAEVGHLVLSTLHANNALGVVHRIIDSFPADQQRQIANQLAASLFGICSVRLLPRIGGGLVPACEIMFNTNAVSNLIREGRVASLYSVIETGKEDGMISLEQSLAELVSSNQISLEVARLYASDERILMKNL